LKRKTFISTTVALLAGVISLLFIFRKKFGQLYQPLIYPESLVILFDKKTITALGTSYRSKHISENDVKKLKQLLLVDSSGNIYDEEDKIEIGEMLKKETKNDFIISRTTTVNGWVLSVTEARQCALYSLSGF
jgi:hypothetical protein